MEQDHGVAGVGGAPDKPGAGDVGQDDVGVRVSGRQAMRYQRHLQDMLNVIKNGFF